MSEPSGQNQVTVTVEGYKFPKSELHKIEQRVNELLHNLSYDPGQLQTQGNIEIGGYEKMVVSW